jgi:hypothetical protein
MCSGFMSEDMKGSKGDLLYVEENAGLLGLLRVVNKNHKTWSAGRVKFFFSAKVGRTTGTW